MTLAALQSAAPTIAGQPLEVHSVTALPDGSHAVLWAWRESLGESVAEAGESEADLLARLVTALTPPEVTLRCEDGSVIAPDGSVLA